MYAVIVTGGKQYKVTEGDEIKVEKLPVEVGSEITFDQVLLVSDDGNLTTGKPYVENAKVTGSVMAQDKAKKVIVYKYRPKKDSSKKQGHRQPYTKIKINKIEA